MFVLNYCKLCASSFLEYDGTSRFYFNEINSKDSVTLISVGPT